MNISKAALPFFCIIALLSAYATMMRTYSSTETKDELEDASRQTIIPSPGFPVGWAPFRESFVGTEGEAFLIAVDVDCPSKSPTGNEVELLPPTPSFVHLSPSFLGTQIPRLAHIISVAPLPGDAGKYQIKIKAVPCYGSGGSELTFKLKIKRAQ